MSAPRPREDARRSNERPHVLIVTDDPDFSTFLGEGLMMGGFWTSIIVHGLQVLEVFRLRQFDLIVLDLQLGNFDAVELLQRLRGASDRTTDATARTAAPVLLMSSIPVTLDGIALDALGVVGLLVAPIELEDVVRELHGAFETWRAAYPDAPLSDEALLG